MQVLPDIRCSQDCVQPAKTLGYMINSRHSAVISDVELSVLKVSLLERVQLRDPSSITTSSVAATLSPPRPTDHVVGRQQPITASLPSSASSRERKGAQLITSSANSVAVCRKQLKRSAWNCAMVALIPVYMATSYLSRYHVLRRAVWPRPNVVW